jgi:hypothetical protein
MVLACVCLLLQAFRVNVKYIEIGWLGLFFWCLALTIPMFAHVGQVAAVVIVVLIVLLVVVAVKRTP